MLLIDPRKYASPFAARARVPRAELFAGLFVLGCANGLAVRASRAVTQYGWLDSVFATFNISLVAWAACFAGVFLVFRDKVSQLQLLDLVVAAVFSTLVFLPIASLSWLAVAGLSLYILLFTESSSSDRRGAIILLATTVPMLWSPLLFDFFARFVLEVDASFVSGILGTHRTGNIVEFADHSASLVIFPACSSLSNMSLAFLCWVTLSQLVRHMWNPRDLLWCLLACISVVVINVSRICLMGLSISYYEAIHSFTGNIVTNVIILGFTVGISLLGLRQEVFSGIVKTKDSSKSFPTSSSAGRPF